MAAPSGEMDGQGHRLAGASISEADPETAAFRCAHGDAAGVIRVAHLPAAGLVRRSRSPRRRDPGSGRDDIRLHLRPQPGRRRPGRGRRTWPLGSRRCKAGGFQNRGQGGESAGLPANQNRSSTRNFEVDRLISHTQNPRGTVQRLSVAVVIDSRSQLKDDGTVEKVAYSEEEIKRFESLIKESIGFDQNRGDSVSVINTDFVSVEQEMTELPLWQSLLGETWIVDLVKQILGAIGLLIVYLIFGRPFLRSLNPNRVELEQQHIDPQTGELVDEGTAEPGQAGSGTHVNADGHLELGEDPNSAAALIRRSNATHEQKVEMARTLVIDDPARVANVMRHWVSEDQ